MRYWILEQEDFTRYHGPNYVTVYSADERHIETEDSCDLEHIKSLFPGYTIEEVFGDD